MLNLLALAPVLGVVKLEELWNVLEGTVVFVLLGLIVFAVAFAIVVLVAPFSVKKEIEEDQNVSLAIIIGAIIIGVAMIISAAIQG
ncbi:MAG: hypothetical protein UZ17_ACD001001760 [Acidobacteria bacterium OLB17]|nr:MAG: hypothetical protein UZ17_ACD001001760 [Acidobacteria bacterium OLB17]MCZ2390659.1 DUF350 domain-containing protein [Acidobacteriota bacterium]